MRGHCDDVPGMRSVVSVSQVKKKSSSLTKMRQTRANVDNPAKGVSKPKKKAAKVEKGVGFNRKQITSAASVPCSVIAKQSYSESAKSCYTNDQLRKMMRVLALYPKENPGAIPPNANLYDPSDMKPYAKKHQRKSGMIETLKVPLGAKQEEWPDKLPYGFSNSKISRSKGYMNDKRIKPRAYDKDELEARWKLPNDAYNDATQCDLDGIQAGYARLAPRIVVVDALRQGTPLINKTLYKTIGQRIRKVLSLRGGRPSSKFYVWLYNPGNHWTVFINDKRGKRNIGYYIDSFGRGGVPPIFQKLAEKLKIKKEDIVVNTHKFQRDGSQCGMWSIFFGYSIYKGDSLPKLVASGVSDNDMKRMRKVLFVQGKGIAADLVEHVVEAT